MWFLVNESNTAINLCSSNFMISVDDDMPLSYMNTNITEIKYAPVHKTHTIFSNSEFFKLK
jgi:hypothetical protein